MAIRAYKLAVSAAHGVEPRWVDAGEHNDEQELALRLGAGTYRIYKPTKAVVKGSGAAVNETPTGWRFEREVEITLDENAPKASIRKARP